MSKRAEERGLEALPPRWRKTIDGKGRVDSVLPVRKFYIRAYEQAEKDLEETMERDALKCYEQGYKQAEKDLGWHSVKESLPEIDEEVIVLRDEHGTAPIYNVGVAHIVDRRYAMDFNGWNIPGVKYWMPMPKIPNEEKK